MSFSKIKRDGKNIHGKPKSKPEDVASEIERLLEDRGVAPLASKAVTLGKQIGKGRFKRVMQGALRQKCGQECVDVVILRYAKRNSEVNELDILALLAGYAAHSSAFIPEVFGVVNENTAVSVIQELAVWGTMKSCLSCPSASAQITIQHKLYAAVQISRAVDFLTSVRLVHADLACRNVLVHRLEECPHELVTKITDFGLAVFLRTGIEEVFHKQPQATRWCSPETVTYNKLSYKSDVWSLGVTLWELFADGAQPWARLEKRADVTAQLNRMTKPCDENETEVDLSAEFTLSEEACPKVAYDLVLSCLNVFEHARPVAADIAQSLAKELPEVPEEPKEPVRLDDESSSASSPMVSPRGNRCSSASTEASMEIGSSSASTPASTPNASSFSKTLVRQLSSKMLDVESGEVKGESKFEVLREFLWSKQALKCLGSEAVKSMQEEVRCAIKRDVYLSKSQSSSSECGTDEQGYRRCRAGMVEIDLQTEQVTSKEVEVQTDEAPIRDVFLKRTNNTGDGRLRCWGTNPPLSIWTLWSLAEDDALRRRDFVNEDAAKAALAAEGIGGALVQSLVYSTHRPGL